MNSISTTPSQVVQPIASPLMNDNNQQKEIKENKSVKDKEKIKEPKTKKLKVKEIKVKKMKDRHTGTLYLRIGPMFCGKTTWLNGELTQLADKGFNVVKIIHGDDIRDDVASSDNSGTTHNSSYRSLSDKITVIRTLTLKGLELNKFHAIGIDEAQFFPDLIEACDELVEHQGKHVRVAGLDGDAFKHKFGQVLDLIPMCDEVQKLRASCKVCLKELEQKKFRGNILAIEGSFTKRLGKSTEQKDVGGSDKYIPVCRYHHSQNK